MGGTVKAEHINPFISATVRTFQTMVYSTAHPGKVTLAADGAIRSDVSGVIGEIVNIVAGAAKAELSQFQIQISLPSVLLGEAQAHPMLKGIVPMVVPFQCPQGNFNLVVRFQSEN